MKLFDTAFIITLASFCCLTHAAGNIRLGVLAFGTANWELETIRNHGLDKNRAISLELRPVANPQAAKIALQSGAVDIIVTDWIWVSRQRSTGSDYTFAPYSNTSGGLIVPAESGINSLEDLKGKRLGIAGGELDKNWLLLQALAQQKIQLDLNSSVEKVYGAPPLLNQQLVHNNLDAVVNYWHYAAQLEAKGYRKLLDGKEILARLGIDETLPTLGYVFRENWADKNPAAIVGFLQASHEAKDILCRSDTAWAAIVPLTRTADPSTLKVMRERYCEGRIRTWGKSERQAARKIYAVLRQMAGDKLTGKSPKLQAGTFWNYEIDG